MHTLKTNTDRVFDTVEFFPSKFPLPAPNSTEILYNTAQEIIQQLKNPHPATPYFQQANPDRQALDQLAEIFANHTQNTQRLPRLGQPNTLKANSITNVTPETPLDDMFLQAIPDPIAYGNGVYDPNSGKTMEYRELIQHPNTKDVWQQSSAKEFAQCAQGLPQLNIQGSDTITFITKDQVPAGRFPTYARFVIELRPMKVDPTRTRLTVGGNLISYPGKTSSPTADITMFKILIVDTLFTPGARICMGDIKNFYLSTPMQCKENMKIPLDLIPTIVQKHYKLTEIAHNGFVYVQINKGMYGLPQAGILANELLEKRLSQHGYYQCRHTPGLWRHHTKPIKFCLVVDDLAISYTDKQDAQDLFSILQQHYKGVTVDWDAKLYCGIHVNWDYDKHTAELTMPNYIKQTLKTYQHPTPKRQQHSPFLAHQPQYGPNQTPEPIDTTAPIPLNRKRPIQQIIGKLLYYARAVDPTLLVAISHIASTQANPTEQTEEEVAHLLDYCTTHPDACTVLYNSTMQLHVHSDASYLNAPKARS